MTLTQDQVSACGSAREMNLMVVCCHLGEGGGGLAMGFCWTMNGVLMAMEDQWWLEFLEKYLVCAYFSPLRSSLFSFLSTSLPPLFGC